MEIVIEVEMSQELDGGGTLRRLRVAMGSGDARRATTAHVLELPLATTRVRIERLEPAERILQWSADAGVAHAINGGFFTKPEHRPLGELRVDGRSVTAKSFGAPWNGVRGALAVDDGGELHLGSFAQLASSTDEAAPPHLLQAGPLLVHGARVVVAEHDPEGFSSTQGEFDSDITAEPLPRMAVGTTPGGVLAVAIDGRDPHDSGLTFPELAHLLVELGAVAALNLDGGSSSSLVVEGELRNRPRDDEGELLAGGYPTPTVLAFVPR